MNYSSRCEITFAEKVEDFLGEKVKETEPLILACGLSSLSNDEQLAYFGKYENTAVKVHLKKSIDNIHSIKINGVKKTIFTTKKHKNSMVVILV